MGMLLTTSAAASFLHAWAVMGAHESDSRHTCAAQLPIRVLVDKKIMGIVAVWYSISHIHTHQKGP